MDGLLDRLRQRKIVQWALAYLAGAFALLQAVDIIGQRFGWPDTIVRVLIVVLAVGFFAALVLAWYHGERGEQRVSGVEISLLALLLAIGGGILWRVAVSTRAGDASLPIAAIGAAASLGAASTAVLPFVNMSADKANEYFSDGMTETLLNRLAQVPELKVAARTSSFSFKGTNTDMRKIAAALGVASIVEGSVQQSGDTLRITAQLIRAVDGTHLWSHNYDRKSADLFAIQDEIAAVGHRSADRRAVAEDEGDPRQGRHARSRRLRRLHARPAADRDQFDPVDPAGRGADEAGARARSELCRRDGRPHAVGPVA